MATANVEEDHANLDTPTPTPYTPTATVSVPAFLLGKHDNAMLEGHPCKISKVKNCIDCEGIDRKLFRGRDIFTNNKYTEYVPSPTTFKMEVPIVNHKEYELVRISYKGYAYLVDASGGTRTRVLFPGGDLGAKIKSEFSFPGKRKRVFCMVMYCCGKQRIIDTRSTDVETAVEDQSTDPSEQPVELEDQPI